MRTLISLALLFVAFLPVQAQEKAHARGYIPPTRQVQIQRSAAMKARHDSRMAYLPKQTDATFDIVAKGWTIPVGDQGNCGSCWLYSAVLNISSCYVKNGYGADWRFSYQHMMDCGPNGDPCGGGDEYDIFQVAKSDGLVTEADYGVPYQESKGRCRYTNQKKWKIGDFLYCDPVQQSGRTSTQAIKNAMVSYGMVSIALDATRFNGYTGGVMTTGQNIDHAVNIVGWDDSKQVMAEKSTPMDLPRLASTGAFRVQNQWGVGWGLQGFCWVSYNSYLVEGMVCSVAALPPPPPPPPGPTPPPTPVPGETLYKMTTAADGTITFVPSASSGVLTPDQFQALKDEVKKLQDLLNQQQSKGAAPCGEVKALKDRLEALEKKVADNKTATDKNIDDLIDAVKDNTKAVEKLMMKKETRATPPAVQPPSDNPLLIVRVPPGTPPVTVNDLPTRSTAPERKIELTAAPAQGAGIYDVAAIIHGTQYTRRVTIARGQTAVVDFNSRP